MRIAVSGETPGKAYNLEEIASYIRAYGADAIELWPENVPGEPDVRRFYRGRDLGAAEKILARAGVDTACVAFGAAFDRALTADESTYARELARAVEVAAQLGANRVNHYLYYLSMTPRADLERLKRIFSPALERAEQLGVTLVLEDEAHDSTRDPREMLRIVRAFDSPYFRTNFDAINYDQASFEGFPGAYATLRGHISYVHIKDGCIYNPEAGHMIDSLGGDMTGANAGNKIYYPFIGTGKLNIPGLLQVLHADGYDGFCTIEPHTSIELWHAYAKEEIRYLQATGFFDTPPRRMITTPSPDA